MKSKVAAMNNKYLRIFLSLLVFTSSVNNINSQVNYANVYIWELEYFGISQETLDCGMLRNIKWETYDVMYQPASGSCEKNGDDTYKVSIIVKQFSAYKENDGGGTPGNYKITLEYDYCTKEWDGAWENCQYSYSIPVLKITGIIGSPILLKEQPLEFNMSDILSKMTETPNGVLFDYFEVSPNNGISWSKVITTYRPVIGSNSLSYYEIMNGHPEWLGKELLIRPVYSGNSDLQNNIYYFKYVEPLNLTLTPVQPICHNDMGSVNVNINTALPSGINNILTNVYIEGTGGCVDVEGVSFCRGGGIGTYENTLPDGIKSFSIDNLSPGKYLLETYHVGVNTLYPAYNIVTISQPPVQSQAKIEYRDTYNSAYHAGSCASLGVLRSSLSQGSILDNSGNILGNISGGYCSINSNYTGIIQVKDNNGCIANLTDLQTIDFKKAPTLSLSLKNPKNVACFEGNDGTLEYDLSGGTGIYSYSFNVSLNHDDVTKKLTGLKAGSVTMNVTDNAGCPISASYSLTQPSSLPSISNVTSTPPKCSYSSDAVLTITGAGGTTPYRKYNIGSGYFDFTNGNQITGLAGNTPYNIFIEDNNGCRSSSAYPYTTPVPPGVIQESITGLLAELCEVANDGQVTITVSQGTSNADGYDITFGGNPSVRSFSLPKINLTHGTYPFTIIDGNNCIKTGNIIVPLSNDSIDFASPVTIDSTTCNEMADGAMTISIDPGARPNPPYNYYISGPSPNSIESLNNTLKSFDNLKTGDYTITIADSKGCKREKGITLAPKSSRFQIIPTTDFALCNNSPTGKVTVSRKAGTGTGGIITFSFMGSTKDDPDAAIFDNIKPGEYTVTAINEGCTDTRSFTILPSPNALTIGATKVRDAACGGSLTGIVNAFRNPGKGIGKVQFTLGDTTKENASNANFYKLANKTGYSVTAIDEAGCEASATFDIGIDPNTLQLHSSVLAHAACANSPSGSILASSLHNGVKTGWGTITFNVDKDILDWEEATFDSLPNNTYIVKALDSVGCSAQETITINALPNPVNIVDIISGSQSCTGLSDGYIGLGATTSASVPQPARFVYKNLTLNKTSGWKDTTLYRHLNAGSYEIMVTDSNRCSKTTFVTITNKGNNPVVSLKGLTPYDSLSCANAKNGVIRVGSVQPERKPPYNFSLKNVSQTDSTFSGLSYIKDTIFVTDNIGCKGFVKIETPVMKNSIRFNNNPVPLHASCKVANNGSITATAINGIPFTGGKYKYKIGPNDSIVGISAEFKKLEAGKVYTVQAFDAFGCEAAPVLVGIGVRDDSLQLGLPLPVNATCPEKATGRMSVARLNGTPKSKGYSFSIKQNENTVLELNDSRSTVPFTGLMAGNYIVAVTDSNNCSVSRPFTIDYTPTFTSSGILTSKVKKYGTAQGSITSVLNGGNNFYEYKLYDLGNTMTPLQTGLTNDTVHLTNLYSNAYLLQVRDTANCLSMDGKDEWLRDTVEVVQPLEALAISIHNKTNVACYGENTGSVIVTSLGGWGDYKYAKNNKVSFSRDSIFNFLKQGVDTFFVRDAEGIDTSIIVTITQPLAPLSASATTVQTQCFDDANGSIQVSSQGGTAPYFVSADSTTWYSTSFINDLKANTYNVIVRDALGCLSRIKNITVNQPDPISVKQFNVLNTPCLQNKGSINISSIQGGNGGYSLNWYNGSDMFSTESGISNLYSGNYRLSLTDNKNCKGDTTFFVSDLSNLKLNFLTTPVNCFGQSNGVAEIEIVSGVLDSIQWPGQSFSKMMKNTSLKAGVHNVKIIDNVGCKKDTSFMMDSEKEITVSDRWITPPLCLGNNNGSIRILADGGVPSYSYDWNNNIKGNEAQNLGSGAYEVTVTDANNCQKTFGFDLAYQQVEKPNLGKDLLLCGRSDYLLSLPGYEKYRWLFNSKSVSAESSLVAKEPGSYVVEVLTADKCIGSDTLNVAFSTDTLKADFLMATKAATGDTLMLIEISQPMPDSVAWILPAEGKLIDYGKYYKQIVISDTGTYEFVMLAYNKGCADMVTKYIQVVTPEEFGPRLKSGKNDLIQSVVLFPNPSSGQFGADIKLSQKADIWMRLIRLSTGTTEYLRTSKGSDLYTERFNLDLKPGLYTLYIQAGQESRTVNLIIQK